MDPLSSFTCATFADRVGETFNAAGVELVLASASESPGGAVARHGGPFTLVFRGPLEPALGQGTHEICHDGLGEFPLFLVPIGRDDAMSYEAVFN
jgi:hypothetical protein